MTHVVILLLSGIESEIVSSAFYCFEARVDFNQTIL
jgi:hypothetical protein